MWEAGILGDNTHVAIIDDGVEWQNPDIQDNFVSHFIYDFLAKILCFYAGRIKYDTPGKELIDESAIII